MYSLGNHYNNSNRFASVLFLFYICRKLKSFIMNRINTFLTGTVGAGGVELINQIPVPEIDPSHSTVSGVVQIIIGVITIVKMIFPKWFERKRT